MFHLGRIAAAASLWVGCGLLLVGQAAGQSKAAGPGKAATESSAEAIQAYRDAANLQNNGAYDVAAEEWQKFLEAHPRDPLAPKARHYLGVCQIQLKAWEPALATFQTLLREQPQFELREDALLNLASCQYALASGGKAALYDDAAASFAKLLAEFPQGKHVEEALFYQGESLYARGKKEEALRAYERLIKEFPQSRRRAETLYAQGVAQEELGRQAAAVATYDRFLSEFANHALRSEVRLRKGECLLQTGDAAAAERLFAELADAKDFADAKLAQSRRAVALAKLERFAEAGEVFAKVAGDDPRSPQALEAALAAGRSYYRAGDLAAARKWLEKAQAAGGSGGAEAAHWLCRILLKAGQAAEAAELADKELSKKPAGPFVVHLALDQADAWYALPGKQPDAVAAYLRLASEHRGHELAPQALYNAAFGALEFKRFEESLQHAAEFEQRYPRDKLLADVKYVAAESHLQLKHYAEAQGLYGALAQQHPQHPDVERWRVRQGLAAYLQKDYAATIRTLQDVVSRLELPETRAEAWFLIGGSQFHQGAFDDAARNLEKSLQTLPQGKQADEALLLLGRAQARLGQVPAAKQSISRVIEQFPSSPLLDQAYFRLGELAYDAGDWVEALRHYAVVTARFPQSPLAPYAHYGMGWAQLKRKELKEAIAAFTTLVEKFPEHALVADARYGRALARRQSGDAKEALADLEAYLQARPEAPNLLDVLYERGLAQAATGDQAAAAATFESILQKDPRYAGADKVLYELGWALKADSKDAKAAAAFGRLAREQGSSPLAAEAWFHVGEDLYEKKDYAEAAKAYGEAKQRSSGGELTEKALYKLGWSRFQLKEYDQALAAFRAQAEAAPDGLLAADAAFMQAECLFRQEQFADAWKAYEVALKTKASSPTIEVLARLHAAQAAAQLKNWEASVELLTQIEQQHPQSPLLAEALYELGWARQNLGQTAEALAHYEAAATRARNETGARARFMRGELLFADKKHSEALRDFQRAMYGYGGDDAPPAVKNWQAKSGFEAGRCAEVLAASAADEAAKAGHLASARKFYTFVVEKHPAHELAGDAKKRLAAIGER